MDEGLPPVGARQVYEAIARFLEQTAGDDTRLRDLAALVRGDPDRDESVHTEYDDFLSVADSDPMSPQAALRCVADFARQQLPDPSAQESAYFERIRAAAEEAGPSDPVWVRWLSLLQLAAPSAR